MAIKKAIPTDIYDEDGNMIRIEFHDGSGEHILDALWDDRDEQTSENRTEFRKWAYHMMMQKDYKVDM
ncbi:hypothetical protein UFOVP118_23 [uncultured Caudovirales phage]|uniref:Uncharacterized protein n=1 Tax=uncultured Caudovirales phage TaxID=2100421 RepID=A0A6J5L7Q0_9CAUD|nr:hypothetical protein UFOVP118_23 [uncultured Caudovirales phage]